jgi:hypothetical protein
MCVALRWGAQLGDVWTCLAFALRMWAGAPKLQTCIGAPNLWTCLALLGRPTCGRADVPCVPNLGEVVFVADRFFILGAQLADVPCVVFGRPSCGRALRCFGAPNLGEVVLKSLPPSQNLFLSILQLVFLPSAPLCGCFHCRCVFRCGSCELVFRLGAHLADVPCVAFRAPILRTCGRALNYRRELRLHCGRALRHPTWGRHALPKPW